jgi:hypothetical protein
VPQDLPVSGIRRLAVEDELPPERAADLLVQVCVDEEAAARATGLGREVRSPEPFLLRPGAELRDQRLCFVVLPVERGLVGVHVRLHEDADALAKLDGLVGRAEVGDRHAVSIARG